MNGYELLVPYVVTDRQARAEAQSLARLAQRRAQAPRDVDEAQGASPELEHEPWVPVLLRGYPYDAEFGR